MKTKLQKCIICQKPFSKRIKVRTPRGGPGRFPRKKNQITCSKICSRIYNRISDRMRAIGRIRHAKL